MGRIGKLLPLWIMSFVLAMVCTAAQVMGHPTASVIIKGVASLIFVVTGIVAFRSCVGEAHDRKYRIYGILMILGLVFGTVGDVFLGLSGDIFFLSGVAAFAVGHVFYAAAFLYASGMYKIHAITTIIILVLTGVYMNLVPYIDIKRMLIPCNFYLVVIAFMVGGAVSMKVNGRNNRLSGNLCFIGSIFFFVSDFILLHMFFGPAKSAFFVFINMITYYIAQIMLALSLTGTLASGRAEE